MVYLKYTLLYLLLIGSTESFGQKTIKVNLYTHTNDFVAKKPTHIDAIAEVKFIERKSIVIGKIYDGITGNQIKYGQHAWALAYNSEEYVNLGYAPDYAAFKTTFVKINKSDDQYCLIYPENKAPDMMWQKSNKSNAGNYGGGAMGVVIGESTKLDDEWVDQDGHVNIIFFAQFQKPSEDMKDYKAVLFRLQRQFYGKTLTNLDGINLTQTELKKVTFEEVVEYFETRIFKTQ